MSQEEEISIESKEQQDGMEIQQASSEPLKVGANDPILPNQAFVQESPNMNLHPQWLPTYLPSQDHGVQKILQEALIGEQKKNPPLENNQMEAQEYPITEQQANHFKSLRGSLKRSNQTHQLTEIEKATSQILTSILKRIKWKMYFLSNKPINKGQNARRIDQILRFHIEDRLLYLILKFQGQKVKEMINIYQMKKEYGFELGQYVNYCFYFLESFEKILDKRSLDEAQANYLSQIFGLLSEQDKNFEDLAPFHLKKIYEEKERQEKQEILKEQMMEKKLKKKEQDMKEMEKKKQDEKGQKMVPQGQYDADYHSPYDWAPS